MILISAIITTHNRLLCLKRAIDSVLTQTYSNIECIVVSDNSTDGTNEYCKTIKNVRFISIPEDESRGGNYARNLGIGVAKGEYVAFLDDDDYWLPTKIESQLALAERKQVDFVYCLRVFEFVNQYPIKRVFEKETDFCYEGDLKDKIFQHYVSSTSCFFVRRSLLEKIGLFDERVSMWQDYDLSIRLCYYTKVFFVKEPLVVYTINEVDSKKISNNFAKCPKNMIYLVYKYNSRLREISACSRMKFYDAIVSEIYYRACKCNNRFYKYLLKPWIWISHYFFKFK